MHKTHGYRGVIVGWDAVARAPTEWLEKNNVPVALRQQPMYAVLVDIRDRKEENSRTYVSEVCVCV